MKAELINNMGDDLLVVNAARVSFDKESSWEESVNEYASEDEFYLKEQDKKLLSYLAKHSHWTPFSHPQICVRETVPIFVARQRFKHMVGFTYNEVSRRYVDDEPTFYTPDVWRSRPEGSVKQGSGSDTVTTMYNPIPFCQNDDFCSGDVDSVSNTYEEYLDLAGEVYNNMLKAEVAPEQARMVLPQSMYTSYYVTGSLAAWARAYKQRIECTAQIEIQHLAQQWNDIIQPLYPNSWEALTQ